MPEGATVETKVKPPLTGTTHVPLPWPLLLPWLGVNSHPTPYPLALCQFLSPAVYLYVIFMPFLSPGLILL